MYSIASIIVSEQKQCTCSYDKRCVCVCVFFTLTVRALTIQPSNTLLINRSVANPVLRVHNEVLKVDGSHDGYSPLLKAEGIQIATKPLPRPTTREQSASRRFSFGYELQLVLSGVMPVFF